jgi:hypothetical protein
VTANDCGNEVSRGKRRTRRGATSRSEQNGESKRRVAAAGKFHPLGVFWKIPLHKKLQSVGHPDFEDPLLEFNNVFFHHSTFSFSTTTRIFQFPLYHEMFNFRTLTPPTTVSSKQKRQHAPSASPDRSSNIDSDNTVLLRRRNSKQYPTDF